MILVNLNFGTAVGTASDQNVATARRWYRLPIPGTNPTEYYRWDYRFPFFLVSLGGINNIAGPWFLNSTWYLIDGAAIQGLTAVPNITGDTQSTGEFIEVTNELGGATYDPRTVAFGRFVDTQGGADFIVANLHDVNEQAFPLRIRGRS